MKYIVLILALFFSACSTKQSSYILPSNSLVSIKTIKRQIGVKKVELPEYLDSDKILIKEGNRLSSIDANFATDASTLLTHRAIVDLKRALNNPNVFLYPWDVSKKEGFIVEIKIDDYIYSDGVVNLSGTYFIKNANNSVVSSKNFMLSGSTNKDANSIVVALGELFDNLMLEISQKIAR